MKPAFLIISAIVLIAFTAFVVVSVMSSRQRKREETLTKQAKESAVREYKLKSDTARLGGLLKNVISTSKKRTDSLTRITKQINEIVITRYIPVRDLSSGEFERAFASRYSSEYPARNRPIN